MAVAICIDVVEGEEAPLVFSTALVSQEAERLEQWLAANPSLGALVAEARSLAEAALKEHK